MTHIILEDSYLNNEDSEQQNYRGGLGMVQYFKGNFGINAIYK